MPLVRFLRLPHTTLYSCLFPEGLQPVAFLGVPSCPNESPFTYFRSHFADVVDSSHLPCHRTRSPLPSLCDCPSLPVSFPAPNVPFRANVASASVSLLLCPGTSYFPFHIPWTTNHVLHHFAGGDYPFRCHCSFLDLPLRLLRPPHLFLFASGLNLSRNPYWIFFQGPSAVGFCRFLSVSGFFLVVWPASSYSRILVITECAQVHTFSGRTP